MRNYDFTTTATFTTDDGTVVRYQDLLEGAVGEIKNAEYNGYLTEEDAKDAAQDAALKCIKSAPRFDPAKAKPVTYGIRIGRSCRIDAWHKAQRFGETFSDQNVYDEDGELLENRVISGYRGNEYDAEQSVISSENLDYIWGCIHSLGAKDRLVAEMIIDGVKPKKIAQVLGCTPDAVSVRWHRVRKTLERQLRDLLDEYGYCREAC